MGNIPGKQFQAILERQLENNMEKLRLTSEEDKNLHTSCFCERLRAHVFKCHEPHRALDHQIKFM